MPSSRSSLDKRDIYYRLHKSAGYRARSAYKLIHLDEEFDLFGGVETVVDLCAAPGSWSQVVGERLGPQLASGQAKLVSLDLQPMAPLRNTTTLQADLTTPSTIPLVLSHLSNRKADLVICDGAPDVTGVHDLDAYLHHQLLLAALTLTLAILEKGGTAVYKIFLSPLDPHAALLRQQMRVFFPGQEDEGGWFQEYSDEDEEGRERGDGKGSSSRGFGVDAMGRRGGVWVRKPRSSRKGSGEAFLICRNFDPSTVPLPRTFSPSALANLAQQTTGTLTLESLAHLAADDVQMSAEQKRRWEVLKGWVGKGDLNPMAELSVGLLDSKPMPHDDPKPNGTRSALEIDTSIPPPKTPPAPSSPTITRTEPTPSSTTTATTGRSFAPLSLTMPVASSHLSPPRQSGTPQHHHQHHHRNRSSIDSTSPTSPSTFNLGWDRLGPSPLPSPISPYPPDSADGSSSGGLFGFRRDTSASSREPYALSRYTPAEGGLPTADSDGAISPALSTSSKTDIFFGSTKSDFLPTPPRPLSVASGSGSVSSSTGASVGRAGSIGKGWPGRSLLSNSIALGSGLERDRAATMPATPVGTGTPFLSASRRDQSEVLENEWGLPSRSVEVTSAPTLGSMGALGQRDRRLSGAARVASLSAGQSGFGSGHGRERTDSVSSDKVPTGPILGLPSADSIRALANGNAATSSSSSQPRSTVLPPPVSRLQKPPTADRNRCESQIEREEHRTTNEQEEPSRLSEGYILEPIESGSMDKLVNVQEDDGGGDEGEPETPFNMMGFTTGADVVKSIHRRRELGNSFSGLLPLAKRVGGKRRWKLEKKLGEGAFSAVWAARVDDSDGAISSPNSSNDPLPTIAAIKLLPRKLTTANDRTRISFLREVGVLSRLSHPNIVGFIDDFETRGYYCLALERVDGGELFEVIQDPKWAQIVRTPVEFTMPDSDEVRKVLDPIGEILVRRLFTELIKAVGFLHACGIVHRDIKLENLILTANPLSKLSDTPRAEEIFLSLPPPNQPFIKLTDFGLSRFIDPASPSLTTRCGSESYASPELIMAAKSYDGRDTDSWACGVVLYASIMCQFPFDAPASGGSVRRDEEELRRRAVRIAKAQYSWPKGFGSEGVREVVRRLLVRDPKARARVDDLWELGWMKGAGSVGQAEMSSNVAERGSGVQSGRRRVREGWLSEPMKEGLEGTMG